MTDKKFDIAILGGGPGGYTAAIRASQLGMKVGLIEKEHMGGTCTNIGCIPSKALIHSVSVYAEAKGSKMIGVTASDVQANWSQMQKYRNRCTVKLRRGVESLMKKNAVEVINGFGRLSSVGSIDVDGTRIEADHIILSPGSVARSLPSLPIDGEQVITSDHALLMERLPESLLIVGAGAIGCEFAYIMSTLGVEVTIVEFLEHALPMEDEEISIEYEKVLKARKVKLHTGCSVESVQLTTKGVVAKTSPRDGGEDFRIESDKVLVSVGRGPATGGCGFEDLGIPMERSFIIVDEFNHTGVGNIRAIGDSVGGLMLAHKASAEGILAVETIAGLERKPLAMENIPRCTYSKPEVASVGLDEKDARERHADSITVGKFPFAGCGKAVVLGETQGFAKLIARSDDGRLIGAHIMGPNATDLIATASAAINLGASYEQFSHVVQAHPTLSEVWHEASHDMIDGTINF